MRQEKECGRGATEKGGTLYVCGRGEDMGSKRMYGACLDHTDVLYDMVGWLK